MDAFTRPCDGEQCIICLQAIIPSQEGCFITVPSKRLRRVSKKTQDSFTFRWNVTKRVNGAHGDSWDNAKKGHVATEKRIVSSVEDTLERFCTLEKLRRQAKEVATLLRKSVSTVCFTGAGVSTSSGIPDYRGSGGIDNLGDHAQGELQRKKENVQEEEEEEEDIDYTTLQPTFSHRALVALNTVDMLQYVITQNCDNLHSKAGLPRVYLSELHGNVFIEYCEKCLTQYTRDYCVDVYSTDCYLEPYYQQCETCGHNHYTGRVCERDRCRGNLRDTIVNFGDDLHQFICGGLIAARRKARHADLCLTLGTSLSVFPASELPTLAKKLVIVNLQAEN